MTESSGAMGVAGVRLTGWTNVSKGSRSSSRRSRKLVSTTQEFTMEQFDKSDDLSTSESEKIGASVLERRFSAKAEEILIPFKKRNILFPPVSPSSSSPSSARLLMEDCEKAIAESRAADVPVSSAEKTDVDDEFIPDKFETEHNPTDDDFSGIKMLAAVACIDRSHTDSSLDEVTNMCKFSSTHPKKNPGETIDRINNIKHHGKQLDNLNFLKKQNESDFISPRYPTNWAELPSCSSQKIALCSTTSGNSATIINDQNESLSISKIFHKYPHTLEEIKEENCSSPGVDHEKKVNSQNVQREGSPQDSLSSDEHEDSGVTSGSSSDHDCQKSIVDGPDTPKSDNRGSKSAEIACASHGLPSTGNVRNNRSVFPFFTDDDLRFTSREDGNGVLESYNIVPKCVAAKDDSSRVGVNLGGGDSELEDGEFRDSFVNQWEGSEAEYGEVEQVDYDSDDKDAFIETKEITPVGSMEDETFDTESCKRPRTRSSRTRCDIDFLRKDGMTLFFDFRKAGGEFGADFDYQNRINEDDVRRDCCHSSCLRTRRPRYDQKQHHKGPDFSSYASKDLIRDYSDRRSNRGRGPVLKRCAAEGGNWSREAENTLMYRERFVRQRRQFSHEPNRGGPWQDRYYDGSQQVRAVTRQHSPYYNRPSSRSRPSPSIWDFENRRPGPRPWPESHAFSHPRVGDMRNTAGRRQRDEEFQQWGSHPYDHPLRIRPYSPQRRPVTPKTSPFFNGPLGGRDGGRGVHRAKDQGQRWEVRRWRGPLGIGLGAKRRSEQMLHQGFVEDVSGRRCSKW